MPEIEMFDQLDRPELGASRESLDRATPGDARQLSHLAGDAHQQALEKSGQRKRGGSYYTPPDVVSGLLDLALDPILESRARQGIEATRAIRVIDPACGSGNFLVAVGDRIRRCLEMLGVDAGEAAGAAFGECVTGIDIDETAVDLCRESLLQASKGAAAESAVIDHVLCADALEIGAGQRSLFAADTLDWTDVFELAGCSGGYDLVIGNPPFLSQLATETTRTEDYALRVLEQFDGVATALTDTAVLFLLLGHKVARRDMGIVCLIQPMSVLSARDATSARSQLLDDCQLRALWTCEEAVFDASVRVCAPLLRRGGETDSVSLYAGRDFRPAGEAVIAGSTWSGLLATSKGIPDRKTQSQGTVADIANATADYRDQYYGLRGCVVDRLEASDADFPRLVTSGLIDPASVLWGKRRTKFDKTSFEYPRVEVARLEPRLREWASEGLRPKLMLATQTKILEAVVDEFGTYLASVPVISVTADEIDDLWRLGALLTSPPVTLIAARRHLGAALSTEALKLSASDVLKLPLPENDSAWSLAAEHFMSASRSLESSARNVQLLASAEAMCTAYGLSDDTELLGWWRLRLPKPRRPRS